MQIKKDEIYNKILKVAYKEFLSLGFQKASMRTIAKKSNTNVSNIYNYFKNKNDIFIKILEPTVNFIYKNLEDVKYENNIDLKYNDLESHLNIVEAVANYISNNREYLMLLIFKSKGSSLASFKDDLLDEYTKISIEYSKALSKKETGNVINLSSFVVHCITGIWANFITEVLMHNIEREEIINSGKMLILFTYNGWRDLLSSKI